MRRVLGSDWLVVALLLLGGSLLTAAPARAFDIDLRLGAKGVLSLNNISDADSPPTPTAPWADGRAGVGAGAGLYGELHLSKLAGAELDLLFESNRLFFRGADNGVRFDQRASYEQLRIPLLVKLFLHVSDDVELTGGLGPVMILGLGAHPQTDVTGNTTTLANDNLEHAYHSLYRADAALGAAVAAEIGISFYTLRFQIPIALRFAYNLLGSAAYTDRVKQDMAQGTQSLQAIETYQLCLVIGFGFLIPPREPPPEPEKPKRPADDPFSPF